MAKRGGRGRGSPRSSGIVFQMSASGRKRPI
jgi:hypothetical protein